MNPAPDRIRPACTRRALLTLLVVCFTAALPWRTCATLVTTGSTILFQDNFENVTVGSLPSASVGSWGVFGPGGLVVSNAVPPGAAQGSQYLKMLRIGGGTTLSGDFGTISSGNLQASFSLFIPTDAPNDVFSVLLSSQDGSVTAAGYPGEKVWLTVQPASNNNVYYNNVSLNSVDTGIDYVKGVWQTWQIDYTFVPGLNNDLWTITVDKITSAALHGGVDQNEGNPDLRYLNFYTGANNSAFFLDAVVPEPSAVLLMIAGGGLLWRWRAAKRNP